jgi:hypothetical protein
MRNTDPQKSAFSFVELLGKISSEDRKPRTLVWDWDFGMTAAGYSKLWGLVPT